MSPDEFIFCFPCWLLTDRVCSQPNDVNSSDIEKIRKPKVGTNLAHTHA